MEADEELDTGLSYGTLGESCAPLTCEFIIKNFDALYAGLKEGYNVLGYKYIGPRKRKKLTKGREPKDAKAKSRK
jgi:hypothetical protein